MRRAHVCVCYNRTYILGAKRVPLIVPSFSAWNAPAARWMLEGRAAAAPRLPAAASSTAHSMGTVVVD